MSKSVSVTVGTTPTLIYQADGPDVETVTIDNLTGSDVTIGGPAVVAGSGPVQKTTSPPLVMPLYEDAIYGICATATANVEVFTVTSGSR